MTQADLRLGKTQSARRRYTPYGQSVVSPSLAPEIPWWQHPLNWMRGVETGFGAVVTAPFTPSVKGTEGLSWFEREKAEYEQWDEPSFETQPLFRLPWTPEEVRERPWSIGVKGAIEQVPWFATSIASGGLGLASWTGRTAGIKGLVTAANLGTKALKPVQAVEKAITTAPFKAAGKVTKPLFEAVKSVVPEDSVVNSLMARAIPSEELMNQAYKPGNVRSFAQWAEGKPVAGSVMKALGGEAIFVRPDSDLPMDILRKATVNRARLKDYSKNLEGAVLPRLRQLGNPKQVLGIADDGLVSTAISTEGKSRYLVDILENPSAYQFANPVAEQYVKEFTEIRKILKEMLEKEGLKQSSKVHRIVEGIVTEEGKVVKSKFGSDPTLSRVYETMEEAVQAHLAKGQKILYGTNPNEIMAYEIDRTINRIARKRFTDITKQMGKAPKQIYAETYPQEATKLTELYAKKDALKNAQTILQRMLSYKTLTVPGATLAKLREDLGKYAPELAQSVEMVFATKKPNVERMLKAMSRDVASALKMQPTELNFAVKVIRDINVTWRGKKVITLSDIDDAVRALNVDKELEKKLITNAYTEAYKTNRKSISDFIRMNKDMMTLNIDQTKEAIRPLSKQRSKFLQGYAGRERLPHKPGEVAERPFNAIPEFRNLFFPDEITTYLEKNYFDEGTKWLREMGQVSAISRSLTAVLDDSAPFVQGLFIFGRNPLEWAKATAKQLDFFIQPDNFNKYMALPKTQSLHAEMLKYGSSVQRFEMVEAIPQIEKLAAKIPKAGEVAQKVVQQTYSRAEAAFTGFGQVARDNMWKSLRKATMSEGELQELARTLDLMTGNISTAALGIARTQRDFEQAWVFFSPRFTRASLAFIGDAFRGGMAGAEARKSISGLMAGGSMMYMAASKATGQEPNFNPRSGRFMTIKVGDDYIGVGGMLYSLARLAGNLTTVDNPTNLLKLDRFDNPFVKFMYGKASPLTGIVTSLIEQQDYMGRPFETVADWGRFLVDKVIPFGFQPLFEEEQMGAPAMGAQFVGLRTFPESLWDKRTELRDEYAMGEYGRKFGDLTKLEQRQIDKSSDIQELTKRMTEEGKETPENLTWARWNREAESIEDMFRNEIKQASAEFNATGDGALFKDRVDTAKQVRREMYAHRSLSPDYTMIQEYLNQPKSPEQMSSMKPQDIAREEYYKSMFAPDMYDQFGRYKHQLAQEREQLFTQEFGQDALDYVEAYEGSKWEGTPELKLLQEARQILQDYWQIETQMWSQFPPELKQIADQIEQVERMNPTEGKRMLFAYPQIVWIRKQVALMKQQFKAINPDVAQALRLFYSY